MLTEEEISRRASARRTSLDVAVVVPEPTDLNPELTFKFWYPTWDTWQFRRTLTYWIAIMFGEGSILFVIGASFAMSGVANRNDPHFSEVLDLVLVNTPYCIGAVAFTLGAYAGFLEVINLPDKDDVDRGNQETESLAYCLRGRRHLQALAAVVDLKSLGSYSVNLIGAIAFNIDTLAGYYSSHMSRGMGLCSTWGMATIGGLAFTIGGILDCLNNKIWIGCDWTAQRWMSILNTIGGLCFLIPGVTGLFSPDKVVYFWMIDVIYLIGSLGFLFGSVCLLWMWKNEHYGLGRLPELNNIMRTEKPPTAVVDFHAEYGCGKSAANQIPWLFLYQINASISVVDISLALGAPGTVSEDSWCRSLQACCGFLLSHGILLLGSVIHHVPTKRPFNWLLMFMRFVLLLYTIHAAWAVWLEIRVLLQAHPAAVGREESILV